MEKKGNANTHKNHRSRLKAKVKNNGLNCLAYHEILELFLTYTIPRRDTNPIGHNLLEYFGSFSNVVDADYNDLLKVEGIGPESALFFNVLSDFIEIYNNSKAQQKTHILNSTFACVKFFRELFTIKNNEFMIMACLSKNRKVLKTFRYKGKDDTEINFDLKQINNGINNQGVYSIVLFHTHPSGNVNPSFSDLQTTQNIINMCLSHGIDFMDHIILNETEYYSFDQNNLIEKMKSMFLKAVDVSSLYLETISKDKKLSDKEKIDKE